MSETVRYETTQIVACNPHGWLARAWTSNPHCRYCGVRTTDPREAYRSDGTHATTDHVLPRSRGGGNPDNRVIACRDCNALKGDLTLEEFEEAVIFVTEMGYQAERGGDGYRPLRNWGSLRSFWAARMEKTKTKTRQVSDHAVLRYLERVKGVDVGAIRDELREIADEAVPAKDGEHHWHAATETVVVVGKGGHVITVLSAKQTEKWRGRKLANGERVPPDA